MILPHDLAAPALTRQQAADLALQQDRQRRTIGHPLGTVRPLPATVRALVRGTLKR